jgi:CheY-like chemotaxis protein
VPLGDATRLANSRFKNVLPIIKWPASRKARIILDVPNIVEHAYPSKLYEPRHRSCSGFFVADPSNENAFIAVIFVPEDEHLTRRSVAKPLRSSFSCVAAMSARILLVEDESITRAYLADILRKDGYQVREARDGAEGVALFENDHFDVVVTDLVMPRLDGFKLTARVRSISPHIPVVLVTAYLSRQLGKVILEGEAEFVGKPVEPHVLLATIQHLLAGPGSTTSH